MRYYPIFLDVRDRPCLVVGGGPVGARKAETLLDCGADVTVVSPETVDDIDKLAETGRITLHKRPYAAADLEGRFLVVGATSDRTLNRQIHRDAENRNMLCNIADQPDVCNFILPSVIRRGDLALAVSTGGASPAFAKKLRRDLEKAFGPEYAVFLRLMKGVRQRLLAEDHAHEAHKPLFEALINSDLLDCIRADDTAGADRILSDALGPGFTWDALMRT